MKEKILNLAKIHFIKSPIEEANEIDVVYNSTYGEVFDGALNGFCESIKNEGDISKFMQKMMFSATKKTKGLKDERSNLSDGDTKMEATLNARIDFNQMMISFNDIINEK